MAKSQRKPQQQTSRWLRLFCPCSYPGAPGPGYMDPSILSVSILSTNNNNNNINNNCSNPLQERSSSTLSSLETETGTTTTSTLVSLSPFMSSSSTITTTTTKTTSSSSILSSSSTLTSSNNYRAPVRRKRRRTLLINCRHLSWALFSLIWFGNPLFIVGCSGIIGNDDLRSLNHYHHHHTIRHHQQLSTNDRNAHNGDDAHDDDDNDDGDGDDDVDDDDVDRFTSYSRSSSNSISGSIKDLSEKRNNNHNRIDNTDATTKLHQFNSNYDIHRGHNQRTANNYHRQRNNDNAMTDDTHMATLTSMAAPPSPSTSINILVDDQSKSSKSILASIGCPNCIYNVEPIISNQNFDISSATLSRSTSTIMSLLENDSVDERRKTDQSKSIVDRHYQTSHKLLNIDIDRSNDPDHHHNDNSYRSNGNKLSSLSSSTTTTSSSLQPNIFFGGYHNEEEEDKLSQIAKTTTTGTATFPPTQSSSSPAPPPPLLVTSDSIRIESIKHQILQKLGFKTKPNITHELPKQIILETLSRAEEINSLINHSNNNDDADDSDGDDHLVFEQNQQQIAGRKNRHHHQQQPQQQQYQYGRYSDSDISDYYGRRDSTVPSSSSIVHYSNGPYDSDSEPDDFYGRTREIISFADKGEILNGQRLIEFTTSDDRVTNGHNLHIRTAILWIKIELRSGYRKYRRKNMGQNEKSLRIWVFRVIEPYFIHNYTFLVDKEFDQRTEMSSSQIVHLSKLGWQKIDVTTTVRKWYAEGTSKRLRLLVDCSGCGDRVQLHIFNNHHYHHHHNNGQQQQQQPRHHQYHHRFSGGSKTTTNNKSKNKILNNDDKNHRLSKSMSMSKSTSSSSSASSSASTSTLEPHRPFLVIYTDPNIMKRVRRRAIDCSGALKGQCCKEKFYVNFKELGWDDWIIAPRGYYANYCQGDCSGPRTPDKFQSYHSHVMEEYRKMDRLSGLQPCCAPLKFSSMSLIYYEENKKIVKRDLPKMVVDECGCP